MPRQTGIMPPVVLSSRALTPLRPSCSTGPRLLVTLERMALYLCYPSSFLMPAAVNPTPALLSNSPWLPALLSQSLSSTHISSALPSCLLPTASSKDPPDHWMTTETHTHTSVSQPCRPRHVPFKLVTTGSIYLYVVQRSQAPAADAACGHPREQIRTSYVSFALLGAAPRTSRPGLHGYSNLGCTSQ